jgi:hypothetical protein
MLYADELVMSANVRWEEQSSTRKHQPAERRRTHLTRPVKEQEKWKDKGSKDGDGGKLGII